MNALNEMIDFAANLVFAAATIIGPIALLQTANAYQPFLILIAGLLLSRLIPNYYDEDISGTTLLQKIVGITCITFGSIMLYVVL